MSLLALFSRTLACFALVFATANPSNYDYLSWLQGDATLAAKALIGAGLLLLYVLFVRIAWLSLGLLGLGLTVTVLLSGILALSELGAVDLASGLTRDYLGLSSMALLLAVGMSWSLIKRRVTGQSNYLNPPP